MRKNRSPWLAQLNAHRKHARLTADLKTDIVIVGAGIAGVATAFFALKHTEKKVAILEKSKLAHGATGHNAGQVVSYFEHGFASLVANYGARLAAEGQAAVEEAWMLLEEIYTEAGLDIPFARFLGHEGLSSFTQLIRELENSMQKRDAGLSAERITVALNAPYIDEIPKKYDGLWSTLPQEHMLEMLETKNPKYFAVVSSPKGVVNSALFCERVVTYLLKAYPHRFSLYEHAPVHKLILREDTALLDVEKWTVLCKRVVLCTNGFENLHIINEGGLEVDARYHSLLRGGIGYMSAYLEPLDKPPTALSYYNEGDETPDANYIYVTRRPYEYEEGMEHNLICIGGPERKLEEASVYNREEEYPEHAVREIEEFVKEVYEREPGDATKYVFTWHGLMGYTKNGVRMVGVEPQNKVLLYNLGCNGVGILPSLMGGRKISRHLAGEEVPPSIFDIPKSAAPSSVSVAQKAATK
jgi:glycine/D-amino acid oxidase-like deaminating enzyme